MVHTNRLDINNSLTLSIWVTKGEQVWRKHREVGHLNSKLINALYCLKMLLSFILNLIDKIFLHLHSKSLSSYYIMLHCHADLATPLKEFIHIVHNDILYSYRVELKHEINSFRTLIP